jgi:hypothetical protein
LTYTSWSVPLVLKLTVTSVPAAMLPLPVTLDWTTPCSAVTISRDVRAELVGGPICDTASAAIATATTPSRYRSQGLDGRSRRVFMGGAIRCRPGRGQVAHSL